MLSAMRWSPVLQAFFAVGLLAGGPGARAEQGRREAEAELAALAARIEALKREAAGGRDAGAELERLLRRAQELAARLERERPGSRVAGDAGPDAQELRERADALRDAADRLAARVAEIDRLLEASRRQRELAGRLEAVGGAGDLLADSRAGRARAPPAAALPGTGPAGSLDGSGSGLAGAPAAGALGAVAAGAAGASGASRGWIDERSLRRERAEALRALAGLRADAEVLEARARALDAAR
jgi:hypothetical protein